MAPAHLLRYGTHADPDLRRAESLDEELLEAETVDVETYLTDARRIERIDEELRTGFASLAHVGKAVSVFGSARTPPGHPRVRRTRARKRRKARRGRLRDHHRRRPGGHGGGQPRRSRRPASPRSASTSSCRTSRRSNQLRRRRADVPLLLRAQGDVRPLRERVRRLPRRLRDARRAVRGGDAAPDARRSATSRSCSSGPTTGAGWSAGSAIRCSRPGTSGLTTSARSRSATTRATCCGSSRTSSTAARARPKARRSDCPAGGSSGS